MPVVDDPSAVLEKQVPMYHLDDDNRYIMVMGVGPEGSGGNYTSFAPFQIPIEYDYDVLDLKHIIQAQLGFDPDDINLRCAGDFRPDEQIGHRDPNRADAGSGSGFASRRTRAASCSAAMRARTSSACDRGAGP
ncbi:hypothetical protein JL720_17240 [Aureococcus anophagefferens]|nr:hypothetical protein JL720_17240 [Aureococcus anophagefferens]